MKVAILLLILWALTSCTFTAQTQYGDISVTPKFPARYDGKTMLSPHYPPAQPSPTPAKKWWQF